MEDIMTDMEPPSDNGIMGDVMTIRAALDGDEWILLMVLQMYNNLTSNNIQSYRPKQLEALKALLYNDVLCVSPTAAGKTLVFTVLPYLRSRPIIICTPLNVIIAEQ